MLLSSRFPQAEVQTSPSWIIASSDTMFWKLSIVVLALCPIVAGFSSFTPSCTALNETVNIVNGTSYRSTWDILFSSLFTIVACTWTIQHLNVPEQRNRRDSGFWGDQKWMLKRMIRSVQWMLGTIVAPELVFGFSLEHLVGALESRRNLRKLAADDGIQWNLKHGFYANMGGFAIKVKLPSEENRSSAALEGVMLSNTGNHPASISPSPPRLPIVDIKHNKSDEDPPHVVSSSDGADRTGSLQIDRSTLEQDKITERKSGQDLPILQFILIHAISLDTNRGPKQDLVIFPTRRLLN